jgi:arylsulfatase A-like enzyme
MNDRKIPIFSVLLSLLLSCSNSRLQKEEAPPRKPNIIYIMSDDHAYQAISAYQGNLIQTPNIDRIGREGAVLDGACVTNSVCSPARAVLLTGKYSHLNGLRDNGTYFNGAQPTFPKMLQQNGYRTAVIGKWHLWTDPTGFDYWNILPAQGNYYNPQFIKNGKDTVYKGYVTDLITDLSLDWISQDKSKPFCLLLFNKAPHRNWMPPLKYLDSFNKRTYPLPHDFYDDYAGRPALQKQQITVAEHLDIRYDSKIACDTCAITKINDWAPAEYQREITRLTPGERKVWDSVYAIEYRKFKALKNKSEIVKFQFQRYMEDYLRCIRSVDDNVGRVLKYLEDNGLADNTIIVYTSDQGFYLGEHGLYDKRFMYEESFRTPMLIRYPKHIPAGQRIKQFTLNLDMAPTLLDYTGTAIPADMQGASMRSLLLKGKAPHWRQEVYYHYYERSFGLTPHYGIRTQRYKLIKFYDIVNAWELYDLNNDPHEMKNLYGQPGYESITAELTQHLRALQQQYKDTIGMVK